MAAAITTTATTLEGQLVEILREMESREQAVAADQRQNRVSVNISGDNSTLTASVLLATSTGGSGGQFAVSPVEYLD